MLLLGSAIIAIFLFSALFGRVWCGWGCPQTVYMEFVFRPIERLLEGGRSGSLALDKAKGVMSPRRILKYLIYLPICLVPGAHLSRVLRGHARRWQNGSGCRRPTIRRRSS